MSKILERNSNKYHDIVSGTIMTVALTFTLFVAVPNIYDIFFTIVVITITAVIVGIAWKWSNTEDMPGNMVLAKDESI